MMRGLQAGFGGHTIAHELAELRRRHVEMVRVDAPDAAPVLEVMAAGLRPLAIVRSVDVIARLPDGVDIELGNEPDIEANGWTVQTYAKAITLAAIRSKAIGARLWVGAVSNLNKRGFAFLASLPWDEIPLTVGVSVHRYPHGNDPRTPHPGFASRVQEVMTLRRLVGMRQFAVSEVGYHTDERKRFLWFKQRWSDADVARHMAWERAFWTTAGAEFVVAYQLNDGSTVADGRYGFRRLDGTWKPVADAFFGTR